MGHDPVRMVLSCGQRRFLGDAPLGSVGILGLEKQFFLAGCTLAQHGSLMQDG